MRSDAGSIKYRESVLPVFPPEVIIGVRSMLENGMEPQELADRLGHMIDVMIEDIAVIKREPKRAEGR